MDQESAINVYTLFDIIDQISHDIDVMVTYSRTNVILCNIAIRT